MGATGGFEMQNYPPLLRGPCPLGAGVHKVNERAECIQLVKWPMSHRCVISLCQAHCRGSGGVGWGESLEVIQNGSQTGSLTKPITALLMHSVRSCAFHEDLGCAHVTQAANKWDIVPGRHYADSSRGSKCHSAVLNIARCA